MPHPSGGYWLEPEHEKVPGVTTILGRFKNAGPLMHWAWTVGMSGQDYRKVRDEAAGIGTIAHEMADAYIRQGCPDSFVFETTQHDQDQAKKAWVAFGGFKEWASGRKFEVCDTEQSMVSRKHRFGGTPDGFIISDQRTIIDFKTSKAVYAEALIQVASYAHLWDENHPDDPCAKGGHILRFDREDGRFSHHWYSDLDNEWECFLLMRDLYDRIKVVEKRTK
jgi:hypothetical protein